MNKNTKLEEGLINIMNKFSLPNLSCNQTPVKFAGRLILFLGMVMVAQVATAIPLVDIVRSLPEGGWAHVNQNKFSDVWPDAKDRLPHTIAQYAPATIINSHSGFAWDSRRGDLIIYGGGHASTAGNEVYLWHGATQLWERGSLPSNVVIPFQFAIGPLYNAIDGVDNAPASAHTYKNNVYLEVADRFLTFGGAAYNTGAAYYKQNSDGTWRVTGPYIWDPSKADGNKVGGTDGSGVDVSVLGGRMWQNRDTQVTASGTQKPNFFVSGTSAYAKEGGKDVIYISTGAALKDLYRYTINDITNPSLDVWELVGINYFTGFSDQAVAGYDPTRKIYVRTGNGVTPFGYWDLTQAAPSNRDVPFTPTVLAGSYDFVNSRNCGMEFDPVRSSYFIWCGGAQVWSMQAPAGTLSPAGWQLGPELGTGAVAPGPIDTTGGVLGKWRYASDLDAYVALKNPIDGEIWIYKPRNWHDPAATKLSQTISFGVLGNKTFGNPAFNVSATASSGLPVSFASLTTSVCAVSGSSVTIRAAGTCTIRASQAGNSNYNPAPNVDRSFGVSLASQTISFGVLGTTGCGFRGPGLLACPWSRPTSWFYA